MAETVERQEGRSGWTARYWLLYWGPVALWLAGIFYVSAQSSWTVFEGPPEVMAMRKSGHIFEYAVLGILLGRALVASRLARGAHLSRPLLQWAWWFGALLTTIYAVSDELHQMLVPRRSGRIEDVAVDALSATAALGIWYIVRVYRLRAEQRGRVATPDRRTQP